MIQFQQGQLTVFQSALYQTTTAVIQSEKAMIVTDPNWLPAEVKAIQAFVKKNIGKRQLYIIYTHSDFDHVLAAGAFPEAITIASEAFVKRSDKEKVLDEIRDFDAQYYVTRDYPIIYPDIDIVIKENGQQEMLGDVNCHFYLAPGHTQDGIMPVVEPYGVLLAGDYLSDVEFPFIIDYDAYLATLNHVARLLPQVKVLVPGHGQTTASRAEMEKRLTESVRYLHDLKAGIDQEPYLVSRYPFYRSLREMHEENKKLL